MIDSKTQIHRAQVDRVGANNKFLTFTQINTHLSMF